MCHTSVVTWVPTILSAHDVTGKHVLEVGSYNVNGSVRPLIERYDPASYLGVDQTPGPGVDQVVNCAALVATFGPSSFDIVVSTEMLEHVEDWAESIAQLCEVVAPGGLLIITTRSTGFPYHAFPDDYWRYSLDTTAEILQRAQFTPEVLVADPQAPGIFCRAAKPYEWTSPWRTKTPAEVFTGVGVEAVTR